MAVQTQIQTRRGTAATWTSTNPTLAAGEIGFESDTNKFKIGTGSTAWASLPYASNVSPLTTKGDLYTFSTTNARLAVGSNGESLVADSSTSTGLRYQVPVNVNPTLNSAFQIWQRGTTSPTTDRVYTADRWQKGSGTNYTHSRQVTGDATNLPFIQYCLRAQRTASSSSTTAVELGSSFESANSIPYAGKTVTMSFYARAGANYSATSSLLLAQLWTGTSTDGNLFSGTLTGAATPLSSNVTLTTTWQRFTITGTLASTTTQIVPYFTYTPTGTAGASDFFDITGVQIEVGSVATPFKTYAGTIQGELAACYRYFQKFGGTQVNESFPYTGFSYSTTQGEGPLTHKGTMRTTPSLAFSTLKISDVASYNLAVTNLTLTTSGSGPDASYLVFTVASGTSSGKINYMRTDASTAGYIYLSAEL